MTSSSAREACGDPALHHVPHFATLRIRQRATRPSLELGQPLLVGRQAREELLREIQTLVIRSRHRVFEELWCAVGHEGSLAAIAKLCQRPADRSGPGRTTENIGLANSSERLPGHVTHQNLVSDKVRIPPLTSTWTIEAETIWNLFQSCFHAGHATHRENAKRAVDLRIGHDVAVAVAANRLVPAMASSRIA